MENPNYIFNWGIVGYGSAGMQFEENIGKVNSNKILAIASKKKPKNNNKVFVSEQELMSYKDINSIYISNLNNQHYRTALNCIENYKDFIIEKPSFIDMAEANSFFQKIKDSSSLVIEGYMNLYHPQLKQLSCLIDDGEIGSIINISASYGFDIRSFFLGFAYHGYKKTHRLLDQTKGGGVVFDLGGYMVSTCRKIVEDSLKKKLNFKINNIKGKFGKTNVDEHACLTMNFEENIKVYLECSIIKQLENNIRIKGSEGTITLTQPWAPREDSEIIIENKKGIKKIKTGTKKNSHIYEIEFFNKVRIAEKNIFAQIRKESLEDIKKNTQILTEWSKKLKELRS
jgi:predicted dehydrogenase